MIWRKKLLGLTASWAGDVDEGAAEGEAGVELMAGILDGGPGRYVWQPSSCKVR